MEKNEIVISDGIGEDVSNKISHFLNAKLTNKWGETFIEFENGIGKGKINNIIFNWGISLLNLDVTFSEEVTLTKIYNGTSPVDFIFLNSGSIDFYTESVSATRLKSYQNIIINYKSDSENSFVFKKDVRVQMNIIEIVPAEYLKKRNHNVAYLKDSLRDIFSTDQKHKLYKHFGNFNLRISDQINQLQNCPHDGIIRTLIIEGHLNIIMGLQVLEHENFMNNVSLPESLTENDIEKIQKACNLIQNNISENISVANLAREVGLSPSKMQFGFKLLHSSTVNEYIKEIKLQYARDYLKNSNLTVSEIVYKIGYNSRSYFSRIFFERYGILPTEYRKNLK